MYLELIVQRCRNEFIGKLSTLNEAVRLIELDFKVNLR